MVILKGIWTFSLSLYPFMSLILFFLFFSFILLPSFRPPTLSESACLYIGWRGFTGTLSTAEGSVS